MEGDGPVWKFSAEGIELEDAFGRAARELNNTKATTLARHAVHAAPRSSPSPSPPLTRTTTVCSASAVRWRCQKTRARLRSGLLPTHRPQAQPCSAVWTTSAASPAEWPSSAQPRLRSGRRTWTRSGRVSRGASPLPQGLPLSPQSPCLCAHSAPCRLTQRRARRIHSAQDALATAQAAAAEARAEAAAARAAATAAESARLVAEATAEVQSALAAQLQSKYTRYKQLYSELYNRSARREGRNGGTPPAPRASHMPKPADGDAASGGASGAQQRAAAPPGAMFTPIAAMPLPSISPPLPSGGPPPVQPAAAAGCAHDAQDAQAVAVVSGPQPALAVPLHPAPPVILPIPHATAAVVPPVRHAIAEAASCGDNGLAVASPPASPSGAASLDATQCCDRAARGLRCEHRAGQEAAAAAVAMAALPAAPPIVPGKWQKRNAAIAIDAGEDFRFLTDASLLPRAKQTSPGAAVGGGVKKPRLREGGNANNTARGRGGGGQSDIDFLFSTPPPAARVGIEGVENQPAEEVADAAAALPSPPKGEKGRTTNWSLEPRKKQQPAGDAEPGARSGGGVAAVPEAADVRHIERRKDVRAGMVTFECAECRGFYDALGLPPAGGERGQCKHQMQGHDATREAVRQQVSRHRTHWQPALTPAGFWNLGFDPTQQPAVSGCVSHGGGVGIQDSSQDCVGWGLPDT